MSCRSMSRRRYWCRSTRTSSPPPSLSLRTRRAPGPRQRVRAVRAGHGRQHAKQLGPQRRQPLDFLLDLGDVPPQQARSRLAWARAGIADDEQLTDLRQPQPEPLRSPDEQQPVHISPPVPAMLAFGPPRDRQQTSSLVIPDRVRSHPGPGSQLPDRQHFSDQIDPHDRNAKPWTALQVQALFSERAVARCAAASATGSRKQQARAHVGERIH